MDSTVESQLVRIFFFGVPALAAAFWLWTKALASLALLLRLWDPPGQRKDHAKPTLMVGGLCLMAALLLAAAIYTASYGIENRPAWILSGACAAFLLGFGDDFLKSRRKDLSALVKLPAQILCAALLLAGDVHLSLFLDPFWNGAFTLLWVVAVINAFNFMDNMDGLAAGVGAIASGCFVAIFLMTDQALLALYAAGLTAFCLGFLPHNFPSARWFLGDSATSLMGYLLAFLSVKGSYIVPQGPGMLAVLVPMAVLAVPLFDLVQVFATRLFSRRAVYVGDQNHLSHHLAKKTGSRKRAVLILWMLSAVLGGLSVAVPQGSIETAGAIFSAQALIFGAVLLYSRACSVDPNQQK